MKRTLIVMGLIISTQSAIAASCPYGQILRVRMGKCVSWHSKLAYAYVGKPVNVSLRKLVIEAGPVAQPPLPPPPKPEDPEDSDTVRLMKAIIIPTTGVK